MAQSIDDSVLNGHPYSAARAVAPRIHAHFARHVDELRARDERTAPVPDVHTIAAVIDAAFWASLRREEGFIPKISIALLPADQSEDALRFAKPLAVRAGTLTRVAPAVERAGIHLGIWPDAEGLCVWGTTRRIPQWCFVLEVAAPGLLVIKHQRGEEAGKFVNVTVLEGDQIKMVDERASSLPDCPSLLASLIGFGTPDSDTDPVNVLVQLAVSMRAHGRGGALLMVPAGSDGWRESIVHPMLYGVAPPYSELRRLTRDDPAATRGRRWQDALGRAVDAIGGLTAVDGATLLTSEYELLGFGAKIARRRGSPQVEQVTVTEPIEGAAPIIVHPTQLGGTRHLSAAQFVYDQRDALALVASQDGHFTVFAWSPCEDMVHAHRVETLLL